jgi:predicted transcriptional regulator
MDRKVLKVGIMSKGDYKRRTIAIAKGDYAPGKGEPKVWFESIQSLAQILSSQNQELLRIIEEQEPSSLKELEELTGRKSSNLSRTLHTLENYGIVELRRTERAIRPIVRATDFEVEFGLNSPWVVQREKERRKSGASRRSGELFSRG